MLVTLTSFAARRDFRYTYVIVPRRINDA